MITLALLLAALCISSVARTQPLSCAPGDGFDWLVMDTGERLKGHVRSMENDSLGFDSESFGEISITWAKVAALYTSQQLTYILSGRSSVVAVACYEHGQLTLNGQAYPARDLQRIIAGRRNELQYWHLAATSGLTLRAGNSGEYTWTNLVNLRREDGTMRLQLQYNGSLGGAQRGVSVNNHTGGGKLDVTAISRSYLIPLLGMLTYDKVKNIALRYVVAVGAGVKVLATDAATWDVDVGPSYASTQLISVEPGGARRRDDPGVLLATRAEIKLNDKLTFSLNWLSLLAVNDWQRSYHHATASIDIKLHESLTLNTSAIFDRLEAPVSTRSGNVPRANDLQLVLGLGVTL